jgi:serine/threonine-protein kinase
MLPETERRAAALAVSRYGADVVRVKAVVRAFLRASADGIRADLLDCLVHEKLLNPTQAGELRLALAKTVIDPHAGKPSPTASSATAQAPARRLHRVAGYRLLRRLGEGGMGDVYCGYDEAGGRQVAIKLLPEQLASCDTFVERFYREARSASHLNHPNLVHGLAVGQDPATGRHYLVMEYVDGPSAQALLGRFGRLAVGDAVHIALDVARALEHAHSRNIIHRDIKPDNILLTTSGVAKLADLGLSKRTDEISNLTGAQQGFGTPYYMAYEQALNARHADGRSDIYALGATLYHLVTGEVPFSGANHFEIGEKKDRGTFLPASKWNPSVPRSLDRILARMLARRPEDRYQTASELIVDLERSDLAAPVPSFIDPARALQDPVVRARLVAPLQHTEADLRHRPGSANGAAAAADIWYVRYRNREGRWCKARATTGQVVQRLRENRLPAGAELSRAQEGPFRPPAEHAEFQLDRESRAAGGLLSSAAAFVRDLLPGRT